MDRRSNQYTPTGAKARVLCGLDGTAEAVPYTKAIAAEGVPYTRAIAAEGVPYTRAIAGEGVPYTKAAAGQSAIACG